MFELQKDEEILFVLPQSRFVFFVPSIVLGIFLVIFVWGMVYYFSWLLFVIWLWTLQILLFWWYSVWIQAQAKNTYVTNQRIIYVEWNFFQPEIESFLLWEVKTLKNFQKGIFAHFFHFGTLEITLTSGEHIQIQYLSEVEEHTKKIVEILK